MILESEPMRLTNFFIAYPCTTLAIGYSILTVLLVVSIQYNMFRIPDADDREYLIADSPELTHWERIVEVDKFSLSDLKTD